MKVEKRHRYVSDSGPRAIRHNDTVTVLASAAHEDMPACSASRRIDVAQASDTTSRERIPPSAPG